MSTTLLYKLSKHQIIAIVLFAREKGRNWKTQLNNSWLKASYQWNHPELSPFLQQVRNEFGPRWLSSVTLPQSVTIARLSEKLHNQAHNQMSEEEWLQHLDSEKAFEFQVSLNPLTRRMISPGTTNSFRDADGNVKQEILQHCAITCRLAVNYDNTWEVVFGEMDWVESDAPLLKSENELPYHCTKKQAWAIAQDLINTLTIFGV